jgi:hypothetical protein
LLCLCVEGNIVVNDQGLRVFFFTYSELFGMQICAHVLANLDKTTHSIGYWTWSTAAWVCGYLLYITVQLSKAFSETK